MEDNILSVENRPELEGPPLVRVQSACYTAEIFRSLDCDCHAQLETSLSRIQGEGGVLLYMLCDGRGAGLLNKIRGLALGKSHSLDTADAYTALGLPADPRDYTRVAEVLRRLAVTEMRLLTNNPRKIAAMASAGFSVHRESLEIDATAHSRAYLQTKATKMGHLFSQFGVLKVATEKR
jgi:GTP cyclohydrolase II